MTALQTPRAAADVELYAEKMASPLIDATSLILMHGIVAIRKAGAFDE